MKSTFRKAALASAVSAAIGMSTTAHAVYVPEDMQGDLLISPMYFTGGGWDTGLRLVNSSETQSAVVKLVFRSHKFSQECLDVFIWLTPGDMWKGSVVDNNGVTTLTSTDDSIQLPNNAAQFASEASPANYPFTEVSDALAALGDSCSWGYAEAIMAWGGSAGAAPLPKSTLVTAYNNVALVTTSDTPNIVSGSTSIQNAGSGVSIGLQMDTFADYDNTSKLSVTVETLLGQNANTDIEELESVMAKDNLVVPYTDMSSTGTFGVFTFPTKMMDNTGTAPRVSNYTPFTTSPPVQTLFTVRDTEENQVQSTEQNYSPVPTTDPNSLPDEVNLLDMSVQVNDFADMGWIKVQLPDDGARRYTGAPVLGSYFQFEITGGGLIKADWLKAAYEKSGGDWADTNPFTNDVTSP